VWGKPAKEGFYYGLQRNITATKLFRNLLQQICPLLSGVQPSYTQLYSPAKGFL
jgi:hypothetical protein